MQSKLFWRIYVSMAILAIACIALAGFVAQRLITRHHLEILKRELTSDARLISRLVQDDLGTNNEKVQRTVLSVKDLKVRTTVILPDGRVVGETDVDPAAMENHADRAEVRQALKEGAGIAQRPSPTEHIQTLYVAIRVGTAEEPKGIVRCALPVSEVEHQMAYFTNVILWCSMLGVGLALLISFIISLMISMPITHMTEVAEDIAAGNFERRARVTAGGELARLGDALNAMRATLVKQITTIERARGHLETIISAMFEGVVALDTDERVLFMNEAAAGVFGTAREQAIGRMLWEVSRNPTLAQYVAQSRAAKSPQTFQWSVQEGRPRHFELTIVPITAPAAPAKEAGPAVPALILVFHDVTALRKLERMRIDFIANVSHELKSPLTSIIGFVETLRYGAINEPAKALEFLEIIHRQTRRLDRLVADLVELSTIEAPDYVPDKQPISLAEVAAKIKESLSQRISQKSLSVDVRAEADVPPVPADRTRMEQVFMNLLDNAVKYTDPGGSISVSVTRMDGAVKVVVRDTGIGIPSRDLPRIFERFYRVDKARSREMGGTGLGLAIVKHIILQHGGSIQAESTLGEGTAIIFTLPVK